MNATLERPTIGETRHTSAGNVFRLDRIEGPWRFVRRIADGTGRSEPLWDADITYRWHASQWEEGIPLVDGDASEFPHFGVFIP